MSRRAWVAHRAARSSDRHSGSSIAVRLDSESGQSTARGPTVGTPNRLRQESLKDSGREGESSDLRLLIVAREALARTARCARSERSGASLPPGRRPSGSERKGIQPPQSGCGGWMPSGDPGDAEARFAKRASGSGSGFCAGTLCRARRRQTLRPPDGRQRNVPSSARHATLARARPPARRASICAGERLRCGSGVE